MFGVYQHLGQVKTLRSSSDPLVLEAFFSPEVLSPSLLCMSQISSHLGLEAIVPETQTFGKHNQPHKLRNEKQNYIRLSHRRDHEVTSMGRSTTYEPQKQCSQILLIGIASTRPGSLSRGSVSLFKLLQAKIQEVCLRVVEYQKVSFDRFSKASSFQILIRWITMACESFHGP